MQNERQPEIGHRSHATIQRVQEAHRKSMPMRGIFFIQMISLCVKISYGHCILPDRVTYFV